MKDQALIRDLMRRVCVTVTEIQREMWRSCFRKTLCGLKRNKGCWLNARRTKRMRLVGEVG